MQMQKNIPLAPFTTFGIGGSADEFVIVHSSDELIDAVSYAKRNTLPFFILGHGANILIGDKGFRGLVIKNEARSVILSEAKDPHTIQEDSSPSVQNDGLIFLTAESGCIVGDLITLTAERGLSGLEHFAGIPSTVGGALWQNLHFLSPDRKKTMFIGDIVIKAEIYSHDERKEVDQMYFQFGYDYSSLHDSQDIVLSATFQLVKEDPNIIQERITANLAWRGEKHPFEAWKNSAGSVFKKIKDHGAGRLIDQVGLKGHQIGGAQISPKHANFIVNTGGATAKDVMALIHLVQQRVHDQLGLDLQPEIRMVGEF